MVLIIKVSLSMRCPDFRGLNVCTLIQMEALDKCDYQSVLIKHLPSKTSDLDKHNNSVSCGIDVWSTINKYSIVLKNEQYKISSTVLYIVKQGIEIVSKLLKGVTGLYAVKYRTKRQTLQQYKQTWLVFA